MKISSKGRYAVRIMASLAKRPNEFVSVAELSENQNISVKYLEKIISMLIKAKLVESARGAAGGYKLAVSASNCTVAQILQATGDLPCLAPCLKQGNSCPIKSRCDSVGCWEKLNLLIIQYLESITIQSLIDKQF